jgi:hypothetical protein
MSSSSSGVSQSCSNFAEKFMGLVEENDSGIGGFLGLQGLLVWRLDLALALAAREIMAIHRRNDIHP